MSEQPSDSAPFLGGPDAAAMPALIEVRDLRVRIEQRDRSVSVVDGVSFRLPAGRALAIIGESGSGKSLTCRALLGLFPAVARVSGSIRFEGKELIGRTERQIRPHRGPDIGMVFQDADNALNPTISVGQQIVESVRLHSSLKGRAAKHRAIELMGVLRIAAPEQVFSLYPHQLSGGLRQRIMIAIAIAPSPKLLIADEATRSLDLITQTEIMQLLFVVRRKLGMALIMVSHDLRLAKCYSDEVLVMYGGRPVEHTATERLFTRPRVPYTKALLDAIPDIEKPRSLTAVSGQCPEADDRPPGCAFSPRCARVGAACVGKQPPFDEHDGSHRWACWHPYDYGVVSP